MTQNSLTSSASAALQKTGPSKSWRVTTAVRVFALAVVVGQMVDRQDVRDVVGPLLGLGIVAVAVCACELQASGPRLAWIPVAEGLMVGLLVGLSGANIEAMAVFLAVPAVVAGVNGGRFSTVNSWLATVVGTALSLAADGSHSGVRLSSALLWLVVGLGAGVLAAHQARSLRRVEAAHAPYAAAHRLVAQLHALMHTRPELLDVATQASGLVDAVRSAAAVKRAAVFALRADRLELVCASGAVGANDEQAGRLCAFSGQLVHRGDSVALPLRVGQDVIGAFVLGGAALMSPADLESVQQRLDEHTVRLETALLVDDVRVAATAEERNRLAREIHDGVAQRVVSLGYLADEVAGVSDDPKVHRAAAELREQVSHLIGELRFSVYDLRHDVHRSGGLPAALTDYVRELSGQSDLRVHLTLDEREARLPRSTEAEVLRIAQEALGNVHRHAGAINVWVTLTVDGRDVRLVVEDDGVGGAVARVGHYGMHTMRERAERIDAAFEVTTRHDGGTTVTVRSRNNNHAFEGAHHDQRLARR